MSRFSSVTSSGGSVRGSLGEELSKYTDPLFLPSRHRIPKSFSDVLLFCQWLYSSNQSFRQAVKRLVAHGVTKLSFVGDAGSKEDREELDKNCRKHVKIMRSLRLAGEDYVAYGACFLRIYFPFVRQLVDDRGSTTRTYALKMFPPGSVTFDLKTLTYEVPDPLQRDKPFSSRSRISLKFRDVKKRSFKGIKLLRLDPRYVKLHYSSWSDDRQVQYSFEPRMKTRIRKGDLFEVNRAPEEVLRCVRDGRDLLFKKDSVFCMINETVSGFLEGGFGLPETIMSFPNLYKMSLYDRLDESFSHESMAPYRWISPSQMPAEGSIDGSQFLTSVRRGIKEQRMDRTAISTSPIPITYQEMGGNGKNLVPKELRAYEQQQLLEGLGIPAELHSGSLRLDQIPYATRIFESAHSDLFEGLSDAAGWAVEKISRFIYNETFEALMEPSSVGDDLARRAMLRDLYMAQEIPRRVLMDSLHLENPLELKKERAREDLQTQEDLAELNEKARRRAEAGSIDDLLSGNSGGPAPPTPVDVMDQATALAHEWLAMPVGQRQQAMGAAEVQDRQLYLMAKDVMDDLRSQGESHGRQMVYQEAQEAMKAP